MMNRKRISNVYRLLVLTLLCLAGGACGSDNDSASLPEVPANPDALCALTPHAVEINQVDASTTPLTRSATGEPEQKATYAENLGHNFSAEATLEAEPRDARTRAAANLAVGAQYRIVVFNAAGAIVGNVVYKQGSADVVSGEAIRLKAGVYRLFAYTFNSASAIRGLDADNRNVTVNSGDDFMTYTNPAFTISSTDYGSGIQLNISFTRQCARLTVRIIVKGGYDNAVTAASLTVRYAFGSGSQWNGYTYPDAVTLPSTDGTASLVKASANDTLVDCGSSADNPYLITQPFTDQNISVSGLSVTIQGMGTKNLPDFTFPNPVTLAKGGSYRLTINVNSYYLLTSSNPVLIGGVKWARTNLQQTGAGVNAPVSFLADPWSSQESGRSVFWNFGMRDGFNCTGFLAAGTGRYDWNTYTSSGTNQDPCSAVGSGWHLLTNRQSDNLCIYRAPKGTKVKINGTINTINEKGWAPDAKGVVFIDGNQVLFLYASGIRIAEGAYSGVGVSGTYWLSDNSGLVSGTDVLYFSETNMMRSDRSRNIGCALRCVQD